MLPRIENGDLTGRRPPTVGRLQKWIDASVTVQGRDDWRFIKLHTHGTQHANADMLLGEPMKRFHTELAEFARSQHDFQYHYVTPWEMSQLVKAGQAKRCDPISVLNGAKSSA